MEMKFCGIGTSHAPGAFSNRHVRPEWFFTCFGTDFVYEWDNSLQIGSAGNMLIIPPNTTIYHGPLPDAKGGFVNDWIILCGDDLDDLLARYPLPVGTPFSIGQPDMFRRYLKSIRQESALQMPGCDDKLLYLTGQLIVDLYRAAQGSAPESLAKLEQVRQLVRQHPEKQWSLAEMAQRSGYSVSRFSALYKDRFGISPKQDLLNVRIDKACKMLQYTAATVSEVSEACGFQSIYYFSKYFKLAKGVSPREYVKSGEFPV